MEILKTGVYAIIVAFILGVLIYPMFIPLLYKLKYGQTIRDDGPQTHLKKAGTPTMGGIAIILGVLITFLIFSKKSMAFSYDGVMVLFVTVGFGLIGLIDDYIKVVKKRSLGLRPMQKIIGQLIISAVFVAYIYKINLGTDIYIPFLNGITLDLKFLFIPFIIIVLLGTVNGVNLTDGLDGLAGGVTIIVSAFLLMMTWKYDPSITPLAGAVIGSLFAFLIFNFYPAKLFMGDTGSLALGGFVASAAILLKMPVFIIIFGFIYLIESISVIIQVVYFKKTQKRFFKMAPIHHHFEKCGWKETKVVLVFYLVTAICCLLAILGAKGI